MIPRRKQQLGGLLIASFSAGVTAWVWHIARTEGKYPLKASFFFPAMAVVGLSLIIVPGYKEERMMRGEDISKLTGSRLITPRWWVILVIAMAAGIANSVLLSL